MCACYSNGLMAMAIVLMLAELRVCILLKRADGDGDSTNVGRVAVIDSKVQFHDGLLG